MGMMTPWGRADSQKELLPHIYSVSTPSHGGIMIAKSEAKVRLSPAAQKHGWSWGNWLCYEEDCEWAIVAWEVPGIWPNFFCRFEGDVKEYILQTLSSWNADFLLEIGVVPSPVEYARWQAQKQEETMYSQKSPDLIVSAWGEWDTNRPGVVRVQTADGKDHFVTSDSYSNRDGLNLLSKCVLV